MITVYASIGNSDDKLSQAQWSRFVEHFMALVHSHATQVHGEWYSAQQAPWQNACICFVLPETLVGTLRERLTSLRQEYGQDSIAWAVATTTFI